MTARPVLATALLVALSQLGLGTALPDAAAAAGGGRPGTVGLPPAASDAHRGGGVYGGGRGGLAPSRPLPSRPAPRIERDYGDGSAGNPVKEPYPYPYYSDTSRGNYGCRKYARRAINTNNRNWWARYQACIDRAGD